jgi:DhnA family fructose-bisphosphate aldolase class Ia
MSASTYSTGHFRFRTEDFFPLSLFQAITDVRVNRPGVVYEQAGKRVRRKQLTTDGKLTILAADHPARRVTNVGDDPVAMGDRYEYLGRILRVITGDQFDGVMAPTDVIEELFIVNYLVCEAGGRGFLDDKVLLGCMNRGGLAGTVFEMDDRFTSFTAETIEGLQLDGAKLMVRIEDSEPASGWTLDYCVQAINELNELGIPVFLEPLPVKKVDGKYQTLKEPVALIKTVGVASALGDSSLNVWLKIPYCDQYEKVARATTLPILMLGGEATGDPTIILNEFAAGMRAGYNVRGALVGRNVIFPGPDDPLATAMAVHKIVHAGYTVEQAVAFLMQSRGEGMDRFSSLRR